MAFLQDYTIKRAAEKDVLLCGVIERSFGRSITNCGRQTNSCLAAYERCLRQVSMMRFDADVVKLFVWR